jgi:hypothetical protein
MIGQHNTGISHLASRGNSSKYISKSAGSFRQILYQIQIRPDFRPATFAVLLQDAEQIFSSNEGLVKNHRLKA